MRLLPCLMLAALLALPGPVRAGEVKPGAPGQVTVFAAASLAEAMDAIVGGFRAATGHRVVVSLAGSSQLVRQIQAGAPADIFVSASAQWMDVLEADGLAVPGTRTGIAGNRLVVIAPAGAAPLALGPDLAARLGQDGPGSNRLAVALTRAVPAGIYARQALTSLGLWDALAPRLAETDNVRAALALVALGEAPMGIVYATDAAAEPRVAVIATFPADSHDPITYPAARIAGRANPAADAFLVWLTGPEARAVLAERGFEVGG